MEEYRSSCGDQDQAGARLLDLRKRAAAFFESSSLVETGRWSDGSSSISNWIGIGDDYRISAEAAFEEASFDAASTACLCSLTAFEVAKELTSATSSGGTALEARIEASRRRLEPCLARLVERIHIEIFDRRMLSGYFLPATAGGSAAPVVVCLGEEGVSVDAMLSRLLPTAFGRSISILFVDGNDASLHRSFKPEQLIAYWLDYLGQRPDVDVGRIAVYGEGTAAGYVSSAAATDRRIAAAVCDGGLWTSFLRRRASLSWMTGVSEEQAFTDSTQLARRMKCPILIVAGRRSVVRAQEALALQADCRRVGVDCAVVVPKSLRSSVGEIENFITADDFVFDWLEHRLVSARRFDDVSYL